ncbi:MAG: hypothetical protein NZ957_02475 [Thaumarchaeota archaeon]|nr:hypothetical protein [Candidatus Calditenuaceae archaeon]
MSRPVRPANLIRPEDVAFIAGQATVPDFKELDSTELRIFDRDLVKTAGYYAMSRDLFSILVEDRDFYLFAAQVAKHQLAGAFRGAVPGSGEVGIQFIRSKTILGTTSWFRSYASPGWNDIHGSAAAPVDLSTTSPVYGNPQNRVILAFPKLGNLTTPKLNEVWFAVRPTNYPIWPIHFARLTDTYVANLPHSVLVVKNNQYYMRGNVEGAGVVDATFPFGLTFALGSYLTGPGQE